MTPTGGVFALVVTAALLVRRGAWRVTSIAVGGVLALNAPWLVAAALTTADGRSDPDGVAAFAARGANWSGPLGALAGTGGIWNAQATLPSRASPLAPLATVLVLALAVSGLRVLRRRWPDGLAWRLVGCAGAGFVVAAAGALPGTADALAWLMSTVPGAGLLRDGQKFLMPYALLVAVCAALGAERLACLAAERSSRLAAGAVLGGALLLPVVVLPDLAFGAAGRLRPVTYPADWDVVAAQIERRPGVVLSLPFETYRAYPWNDGRTVLDPLPRYVDAEVLADDTLRVGDLVVSGENSRLARVRAELAAGRPLATTSVRWVVVQRDAGPPVDATVLAGLRPVHLGEQLQLFENPAAVAGGGEGGRRWSMVAAGVLAVGVALTALVALRPKVAK